MAMIPLGERPELPASVIKELHDRVTYARHRASDRLWDIVAQGSVGLFEGYRGAIARDTPTL